MKEMVGGCCVCSDERGWPENPLVYCDGQGCTVAVHQACYGIVTVPTGPWYCRKCESQERSTKVRCELCPSKDGALKRTDNSGWAHVVCALYIPEVRFGNVTTMEPIILQLIPPERFSKCYICEEVLGKGNPRATIGACMQCNKERCRMQFHVTCAQSLGLLCEEAGNYLDNVKYCGYCQYHYRKLLKRPNIKTIPAYKPVPAVDSHSSDSSPEKDAEKVTTTSATATPTTSTTTKRKSSSSKSSTTTKASTSSTKNNVTEAPKSSSNKVVDKLGNNKPGPSNSAVKKFSADLLQDIATIQAAAAAADKVPPTDKILITAAIETPENPPTPDTDKDSVKSSGSKKRKAESRTPTPAPPEIPLEAVPPPEPEKKLKTDEEPETPVEDKPIVGANGVLINPQVTLEPLYVSNDGGGLKITYEKQDSPVTPEERPRSQSIDNKTERPTRGKKRASTGNTPAASTSSTVTKRVSRSQTASSNIVPPPTIQGGAFSSITQARDSHVKESPPSSPDDSSQRKRKNGGSNSNSIDSKDVKIFQNGINAPHMLGNQLNPNSHMAQKMSDHLNSELEAHSIFSPDAMPASSLVGPQLHNRVIASARGNNSNQSNGSGGGFSMLGVGGSGTIPQTLDQLLERQWEQGSQFLMEQAQHFDIASLLSCLHQLRAENLRLEEHVSSLLQRRDHLLAVNARLAIPLSTQLPISASITPIQTTASSSRPTFTPSSNGPVENGVDSYPRNSEFNRTSSSQPSPTSFNRTNSSQPSPRQSSSYAGQQGVLRGNNNRGQYSSYPQGSIPVVTSQAQHPQVNVRRDNEMHHQMGTSSSKQS